MTIFGQSIYVIPVRRGGAGIQKYLSNPFILSLSKDERWYKVQDKSIRIPVNLGYCIGIHFGRMGRIIPDFKRDIRYFVSLFEFAAKISQP